MIKYTGAKQYIFVSMLKQVAKKMEYKDVLIYHTSFCVILIIEWLRTFHNKSFYNAYDKKINTYNYFIKKKSFILANRLFSIKYSFFQEQTETRWPVILTSLVTR